MRSAVVGLLVVAAGAAHAERAVEIAAGGGVSMPVEDRDRGMEVGSGFSLGAVGIALVDRFGVEARSVHSDAEPWNRLDRFRALANASWSDEGTHRRLSARIGAGVEALYSSRPYTSNWPPYLGERTVRTDERSIGIVVEPAATCVGRLGGIWLGGQVAVPLTRHNYEPMGSQGFYISYIGVDVEARLVAQLSFE